MATHEIFEPLEVEIPPTEILVSANTITAWMFVGRGRRIHTRVVSGKWSVGPHQPDCDGAGVIGSHAPSGRGYPAPDLPEGMLVLGILTPRNELVWLPIGMGQPVDVGPYGGRTFFVINDDITGQSGGIGLLDNRGALKVEVAVEAM